jgi:hypothetical protein
MPNLKKIDVICGLVEPTLHLQPKILNFKLIATLIKKTRTSPLPPSSHLNDAQNFLLNYYRAK